jgi:RNA polymerase sigma-70 factor, ECF subfamily
MRNSLGGGETRSLDVASLDAASLEDLACGVHRHLDGAFERMVERFEKPLFNYAQRMVQNALDAQEVVQDTFLRAHRALTCQYSEERCRALALRPWLFRITRNLCANKRRGLRQELERPMTEALANGETNGRSYFPDWQVPFLCRIEHREELERLDRAIASLPLESRELVALRFIEEMSYAEIASTTGQSEASLRGKVFRALRQLRDVLGDEGRIAGEGGGGGDLPSKEASHAM